MAPRTRMRALAALAVLLETVWIGWVRWPQHRPAGYLLDYAAAALLYLTAGWLILRPRAANEGSETPEREAGQRRLVRLIFWSAVVFRLTLAPLTPAVSQGLWRLHWDGLIQHDGFNPYRYAPQNSLFTPIEAQALGAVPEPAVAAYHPPLAELVLRWSYDWLHGLRRSKLTFIGFDLLLIALLIRMLRARGRPPEWVLLYAWSPLAISEVAGNGQMAPVAVFFGLLGLYWAGRLPRWSAIAAALAALTQWYAWAIAAIVLAAAGRRWRGALAWFAGLVALLFLPYVFMDKHFALGVILGNVRLRAAAAAPFNASLFAAAAGLGRAWAWGLSGLTVAAALGMALRARLEPLRAGMVVVAALLVAAPRVEPGMLLWLLPFLVLWWEPAWFYLALVAPLAYLAPAHGAVAWVEYGPVFALLGWQGLRQPRARSAAA